MYYVYILYSSSRDIYYVGCTGDIEDRLKRHNEGRSKFTKSGVPWKLVYKKEYSSRSEAYQAERYIKSQKNRKYIEKLINGN